MPISLVSLVPRVLLEIVGLAPSVPDAIAESRPAMLVGRKRALACLVLVDVTA